MPDQEDDRDLTYWGSSSRKLGDPDAALMFYAEALSHNPDNMLARSDMDQGLVAAGDLERAKAQLAEIEARGGAFGWAGLSLREAIYIRRTFDQ
jgi:Tfp pilus assembly protein PilF